MPLVEFACSECGERVEMLVRTTAAAVGDSCPKCAGPMQRQLSTFNAATGGTSTGGGCAPRGGFS